MRVMVRAGVKVRVRVKVRVGFKVRVWEGHGCGMWVLGRACEVLGRCVGGAWRHERCMGGARMVRERCLGG